VVALSLGFNLGGPLGETLNLFIANAGQFPTVIHAPDAVAGRSQVLG
jgi:hypothetical protein